MERSPQQRRLTSAEQADVAGLYDAGSSMNDLARLFSVHRSAIVRALQQQGVPRRDDFALKTLDPTTTVDFYELCVERHAKAVATVVTSNREPAEWLAMTSDQLLAQSAVDRLTGHAHTLILEGPSYRQRRP